MTDKFEVTDQMELPYRASNEALAFWTGLHGEPAHIFHRALLAAYEAGKNAPTFARQDGGALTTLPDGTPVNVKP